jgi:hypothetical protein
VEKTVVGKSEQNKYLEEFLLVEGLTILNPSGNYVYRLL